MGFLMPIGILVIRMSNRQECRRRLKIILYIHATLQVINPLDNDGVRNLYKGIQKSVKVSHLAFELKLLLNPVTLKGFNCLHINVYNQKNFVFISIYIV